MYVKIKDNYKKKLQRQITALEKKYGIYLKTLKKYNN
jgi:hypothetical protein